MAWQVTDVRHTSGGMPGSLWYHGFAIIDANTRRPVVSFGYADQEEATAARALMAEAIANAELVMAQ
jgi:hypothetical protein